MIHLPPVQPVYAIGIVSGIVAVVSWLAGAVVDVAVAVGTALAAMWAALTPVLFAIWNAFSGIWSNVLLPAWGYIKSWGEEIWSLYEQHVKPIIDWLNGLLKVARDIYKTFVQPLLDALSALDQFLRVTGLTNTVFGSWLDGEIHRIDATIARLWQEITAPLNLLLHIVNTVILDARGILQAPLLLNSTAHYMGIICGQWWDVSLDTIKTDWTTNLNNFHKGPRIQPSIDAGKALVSDQASTLTDAQEHGVTIFRQIVADDYQGFDYAATGTGPFSENA